MEQSPELHEHLTQGYQKRQDASNMGRQHDHSHNIKRADMFREAAKHYDAALKIADAAGDKSSSRTATTFGKGAHADARDAYKNLAMIERRRGNDGAAMMKFRGLAAEHNDAVKALKSGNAPSDKPKELTPQSAFVEKHREELSKFADPPKKTSELRAGAKAATADAKLATVGVQSGPASHGSWQERADAMNAAAAKHEAASAAWKKLPTSPTPTIAAKYHDAKAAAHREEAKSYQHSADEQARDEHGRFASK